MKTTIKKLLREALLSEKLTDVNQDVEWLYDTYFKEDYEEAERTGKIRNSMFHEADLDTSKLTSPDAIKAHELNPCAIQINRAGNHYNPNAKRISLGVNRQAVNYVIDDNPDGDISGAAYGLGGSSGTSLLAEFKGSSIKGSIHHELAHWLDDTLNNQHIQKRVAQADELGRNSLLTKKSGGNINADKLEIQGMIHNVNQLKKKYGAIWDTLTFDKMTKLSPSLNHLNSSTLKGDTHAIWKRRLLTRMSREGLLGKKMTS